MLIKNNLRENVFSLLTLKGAEYIVNFITLPYLLRVLGPEVYGKIIFSQILMNYGGLFADYGFNMTAPRDIASTDKKNLAKEFSTIYTAKLLLLIVVLLFGSLLWFCLRPNLDFFLLMCFLPLIVGNVIFPVWFFQGIQQMRFITIFNLFARTVSVIGIFLFVSNQSDYYIAAVLQSSVPLLAGIISLIVIANKYPRLYMFPSKKDIWQKLRASWDIFVSTLFINLYTNSNTFILGIMTNDTVVGYYAAANKLIDAVKGLMMPVSNAIFPHVSVLFKDDKEKAISFLCKVVRRVGLGMMMISLLICLFAEYIVELIMGSMYSESVIIFRIISFLPFIVALSNIFGIQTMVAFGMQRIFSRILMFSSLLNFILVFPLIYIGQGVGLAITVVIVESFVTITMYMILRKNNIILR